MALWSVNLKILGKANQAIPARSYTVLLSQMDIPAALLLLGIATAAVIGMLYLFFEPNWVAASGRPVATLL